MKQLFLIFAVTTGYTKPLAVAVSIMFITFMSCLGFWMWADYHEVYLHNEVIAQQAICDSVDPVDRERSLREKERLAKAKAAHNTFSEAIVTRLFIKK